MLADVARGYLLAGGKSSRFGSDKARAPWGAGTLLEMNASVMKNAGMAVTVVAADADAYADLGLRTIADAVPGIGPLGGIFTALRDSAPAPWILVMACDFAGVREAWLGQLWDARDDTHCAVVFGSEFEQPLLGLYAQSLMPALESTIADRQFGVMRFLKTQHILRLPAPDGWEALHNVNSPAEWQRVRPEDA